MRILRTLEGKLTNIFEEIVNMPLYTFNCEDCKESYEVLVPLDKLDKAPIKCPECKKNMQREFPLLKKWSIKVT